MAMTKEQATKLAIDHFTKIETKTLAGRLEGIKEHFKNSNPVDTLPSGPFYDTKGYRGSDYWFLPAQKCSCLQPLQTGQNEEYVAVSKVNGEISTITIQGD